MVSLENSAPLPRTAAPWFGALRQVVASHRFWTYGCSTLIVVLTSWWLGKDVGWDTLHYHLYAGFSALHDRFDLDYFPAGNQTYLNPYGYVPFYLLATSGLTVFEASTVLAVLQSAILWLSYELAVAVASPKDPRTRIAFGVSAAVLAFANPILIDQFGSSFADITTAELMLAGCLLLIGAFRAPGLWRVVATGLLFGGAAAFKLSNALPVASLAIVPLFRPVGWGRRLSDAVLLCLCVAAGFALVSLPWSLQLERHFGNPFFPLLNGVFHSLQYVSGAGLEDRFIPASLAAALWRPFAIATSARMVQFESAAPDPRYVILLLAAVATLVWGLVRRGRTRRTAADGSSGSPEDRALWALGCAFVIDWIVWLVISGNSRYFLPMACIAAILGMALLFRLLARWPKVRYWVVAGVLGLQICQVFAGADFRAPLRYPWNHGTWFDVAKLPALDSTPALYFSIGVQSDAFIVPFLPAGSGFIDLDGDYVLGPDGANGDHVRSLIRRFGPHLRVLVTDARVDADRRTDAPNPLDINYALAPFGLRADTSQCSKIVVPAVPKMRIATIGHVAPRLPWSAWYTLYLTTCNVVEDPGAYNAMLPAERAANRVLNRLEDACPAVLQPRRSVTLRIHDRYQHDDWVRFYGNTDVEAWISQGRLHFESALGQDSVHDEGPVSDWDKTPPPRIACGRTESGLAFLHLVQ
jgi:hypothetical protein